MHYRGRNWGPPGLRAQVTGKSEGWWGRRQQARLRCSWLDKRSRRIWRNMQKIVQAFRAFVAVNHRIDRLAAGVKIDDRWTAFGADHLTLNPHLLVHRHGAGSACEDQRRRHYNNSQKLQLNCPRPSPAGRQAAKGNTG